METININDLSQSQNQLFNDIAAEVRNDFHILVDSIASGKEQNIHWVTSSLASRNISESPLFIRCCQLLLVKRLVEERNVSNIILSDYPLYILLKRYFITKNINVSINCTEKFHKRVKKNLKPVIDFLKIVRLVLSRYHGKSRRKRILPDPDLPITLLDMFVINSKVGEQGSITNGKYIDRYYPGLINLLPDKEKEGIYYLPTTYGFRNYKKIFNDIRSSQNNFMIRDDYLKATDYFLLLIHPLKKLMLKFPDTFFHNVNITPLIIDENWQRCCSKSSIEGLINYYFAYRLSKEKINVRLLIEWYENQIIDRGSIVGFHRFMQKTRIVGYQGFIISQSLHHYVNPSNSEFRSQAVPDEVAVIGKGLEKGVQEFCNQFNVISAPAFRNQNVWNKMKYHPRTDRFVVLVALPMDRNESRKILDVISHLNFNENTEIWIKPHPSYGPDQIESFFSNKNISYKLITGYFNDFLEQANLLISNASITSVESLAKGIPVIIIADKNGIVQNPIPKMIPTLIWKLCFTVKETQLAINYFLRESENNKKIFDGIGIEIRKNYFEPVTTESVRRFLKLD